MFSVSDPEVDRSSDKKQKAKLNIRSDITMYNYRQKTLWGGNIQKHQTAFDDAIMSGFVVFFFLIFTFWNVTLFLS